MTIPRIYQATALTVQTHHELTMAASHHIAKVLRAKVGDVVMLFDGKSAGEYLSMIEQINKKTVIVFIQSYIDKEVESPLRLELAQGIARGEKMDFIIQKAVELGVAKIMPLLTERCTVKLDSAREEKRLQHWQSVIISACEQSGRNQIPQLHAPTLLSQWVKEVKADAKFVLSPHVKEQLPNIALSAQATVSVLIGPEGGLSDREVQQAIDSGFLPLNLGPRVLRTETATIAALSILQYAFGDL